MSKKLKRVVIKEELVALTEDYKKAIILNQLIYWSERIKDVDMFLAEEKKRMEAHGITEEDAKIDFQNGWIYKKAEELSEETMMGIAKGNMNKHIDFLVENGWIDKRRNPKYKWDKTYQYRVNIVKIQKDLQTLGYSLEGYELYQDENIEVTKHDYEVNKTELQNNETLLRGDDSLLCNQQNVTAIPEITSEITYKEKREEEDEEIYNNRTVNESLFHAHCENLRIPEIMQVRFLNEIGNINEYQRAAVNETFKTLRERIDAARRGSGEKIGNFSKWFKATLINAETEVFIATSLEARDNQLSRSRQHDPFPFYNWLDN